MKGSYGKSKNGNFQVIDTVSATHTYCITPRHVGEAADYYGGMLSEESIRSAERKGAKCGRRGCTMSFDQHETALLISCKTDMKNENEEATPELHEYLLKIKKEAESHGYIGFAFKDDREIPTSQS